MILALNKLVYVNFEIWVQKVDVIFEIWVHAVSRKKNHITQKEISLNKKKKCFKQINKCHIRKDRQ